MSGVGSASGLAAGLIGDIPGDPGGIMLVADSWRAAAGRAGEAAELSGRARASAPSWEGLAAQAFTGRAGELETGLGGVAAGLVAGAGVLEEYSTVLARAKVAVLALREQASGVLLSSLGNPAGAVAGAAALAAIARAYLNVLMEVRLAAADAAGALTGMTAGPDGEEAQAGKEKEPPRTDAKKEFSQEDIKRIRQQADGEEPWDPVQQGFIGDCYFLAAFQAYAKTAEGRKLLRDNVTWDESKGAFIVTFYDDGRPVQVEVRDYYADGVRGTPSLIHVYERAYGIYVKDENLNGGHPRDAMEDISGESATRIDTRGGSGFLGWPWGEDHKYTEDEWTEIERAVEDGKPVVAVTSGGDFSGGDEVTAVTDTNDNGKIDDGDEEVRHRIVGGDYDNDGDKEAHAYTVVDIDDEFVTLCNPWGYNHVAPEHSLPPGDDQNGLIKISREDYEKYFAGTEIGG